MKTEKPQGFKDRLTTTDEQGHRVRVIPAPVKGFFQNCRNVVQIVLVIFFLSLPWLTIGEAPVFRLDVPHRQFFFLGHLFMAQDVPGLFFVLASFGVLILLVTALWGRVWCGWTCPQTVFVDGVYRRIERWIEGDVLKQRALDRLPWHHKDRLIKRSLKWFVFLLISLFITHSFLGLFVGGPEVLKMMTHSPSENPGWFLLVMVATAVILFDFAWFREQFCLVACPYGRFQSALMDEESVTVVYDQTRGEPRGKLGTTHGDCVACNKCVQVCPTGIDIRNGFQMECIACTACIDACDSVMEKIHKPKGLIRYDSEKGLLTKHQRWLRPRTIIYVLVLVALLTSLAIRVSNQQKFETEIFRAGNAPYQIQTGANGERIIMNSFKLVFSNLAPTHTHVSLRLTPFIQDLGVELLPNNQSWDINPGHVHRLQIFIRFPESLAASLKETPVELESHWTDKGGTLIEKNIVKVLSPDAPQ